MASLRSSIVTRIRAHAARRNVRYTHKALYECASLGLDAEDILLVLMHLSEEDWSGRIRSKAAAEWMYVLKPNIGETVVHLELILRQACIVISFHEGHDPIDHRDDQERERNQGRICSDGAGRVLAGR